MSSCGWLWNGAEVFPRTPVQGLSAFLTGPEGSWDLESAHGPFLLIPLSPLPSACPVNLVTALYRGSSSFPIPKSHEVVLSHLRLTSREPSQKL